MKATQLDQMREDFVYIKTTKHVTQDKVEQHSEVRISLFTICFYCPQVAKKKTVIVGLSMYTDAGLF